MGDLYALPAPADTFSDADFFHLDNPQVYQQLRALALDLMDAGHSHYSIKGLFEVLRWKAALRTTGKTYKLNNNLTPFYARLLMHNEPRLAGFFHTRQSNGVNT